MADSVPTALDQLFQILWKDSGGNPFTRRPTVMLTGGLTATDDPDNDQTILNGGGGSGGGGQFNVTLANGLNSNVATNALQVLRIGGPTAPFSVGGFTAPASAGTFLLVVNTTSQPMTIVHEDTASTTTQRIDTQSTVPVVLVPRRGSALLIYDTTATRWVLQNPGYDYTRGFDIRNFGAKVDGSTNDRTAVVNADVAAQAAGTHIIFPAGTTIIGASLTIASDVEFAPAALVNPTGTLTLQGRIRADEMQQIFAAGAVVVPSKGHRLSVRWWGAKGDAVSDDAPPIQALAVALNAVANSQTDRGVQLFSQPSVYVPFGVYKLNEEVAFSGQCRIYSDQQAIIYTTSNTNVLFRVGSPGFVIDGLQFSGSRHPIAVNGPTTAFGGTEVGNPAASGFNRIERCLFWNAAGPVLMQDTSAAGQNRTNAAQIAVRDCFFQTPCVFFGTFEEANFEHCYIIATDGQQAMPLDGAGKVLGVFNSAGKLCISECVGVPEFSSTPTACWIQGCGLLKVDDFRFGGESAAVLVRTKFTTAVAYNGSTLPIDTTFSMPQVILQNISPASAIGLNWLECYDTFPNTIVVRGIFSTATGGGSPPIYQGFLSSSGVWLDSAIDLNELGDRPGIVVRFEDLPIGVTAYRLRQSASPSALGVDVTDVVRRHLSRGYLDAGHEYPSLDSSEENLFPQQVVDLAGLTVGLTTNMTSATTETETGYALTIFKATADNASTNWRTGSTFPAGMPRGLYVLSFSIVASNAPGEVMVGISEAGAITATHSRTFTGSPREQRLWIPFWHDGVNAKTFSWQFFGFPHFLADGSTQTQFACGKFQVNRGELPAPYVQPVDSPTAPTVNLNLPRKESLYRHTSSTPPSTGNYKPGDVYLVTPAVAGATNRFECVSSSPLLWAPMGEGASAIRTVTAASDTTQASDGTILVNHAGAVAETLSSATFPAGRHLIIKDISGAAGTNHITLTPSSGTIDGAASYVLSQNYGAVEVRFDGTNWWIT